MICEICNRDSVLISNGICIGCSSDEYYSKRIQNVGMLSKWMEEISDVTKKLKSQKEKSERMSNVCDICERQSDDLNDKKLCMNCQENYYCPNCKDFHYHKSDTGVVKIDDCNKLSKTGWHSSMDFGYKCLGKCGADVNISVTYCSSCANKELKRLKAIVEQYSNLKIYTFENNYKNCCYGTYSIVALDLDSAWNFAHDFENEHNKDFKLSDGSFNGNYIIKFKYVGEKEFKLGIID